MTKSKGINKKHNIGDIIIKSDGTQWKVGVDRKWIYIKKPKEHFKKYQPKKKWVNNFPPVTLPDHIRPTKYPHYYVSNDGVAYREPRRCDENGRFGEVNEYGLIELTTQLRGNPNHGEEFMYEGTNIYFYDEDGKNIGYKKRNIHQLVAETWIPNPHGYPEILHGDKGNRCNHYTNLKWGTHLENMTGVTSPCTTPKSYKITDTTTGKVWKGDNMATWVRENYNFIISRMKSSERTIQAINRHLSSARKKGYKIWNFIVEY